MSETPNIIDATGRCSGLTTSLRPAGAVTATLTIPNRGALSAGRSEKDSLRPIDIDANPPTSRLGETTQPHGTGVYGRPFRCPVWSPCGLRACDAAQIRTTTRSLD